MIKVIIIGGFLIKIIIIKKQQVGIVHPSM